MQPLFTVRSRPQVSLGQYPYDVSADGQRFLVNTFVEEDLVCAHHPSPSTVILNWRPKP